MSNYKLTHLKELESESIFILREVAAQFEKPALLFSGGKDSIVMAYLAYKAFYPAPIIPGSRVREVCTPHLATDPAQCTRAISGLKTRQARETLHIS